MALILQVLGLVLVAVGVGLVFGSGWAVAVAGVECVVLGVAAERSADRAGS